ncbi:hypothetical protein A6770_28840 [Nostoc minutum NIES-26]|uniref:Uncharacterized protein n=1 Tax=Nostoc minutum NIES-26 TaxID=1844469 RepID=A0A367QIP2_9NOSO|nr:hypothetical protein A6770_28840 [Nostoc minutum NIES-26]
MNKQQELQQAWNALMGVDKRYYILTGFYALGDAFLISSKNHMYKNQIVLVEHRHREQINHWDFTCNQSECKSPTITTNGDDGQGNLNRKAPSLKVYN